MTMRLQVLQYKCKSIFELYLVLLSIPFQTKSKQTTWSRVTILVKWYIQHLHKCKSSNSGHFTPTHVKRQRINYRFENTHYYTDRDTISWIILPFSFPTPFRHNGWHKSKCSFGIVFELKVNWCRRTHFEWCFSMDLI